MIGALQCSLLGDTGFRGALLVFGARVSKACKGINLPIILAQAYCQARQENCYATGWGCEENGA